jgi:hypothetical protein
MLAGHVPFLLAGNDETGGSLRSSGNQCVRLGLTGALSAEFHRTRELDQVDHPAGLFDLQAERGRHAFT